MSTTKQLLVEWQDLLKDKNNLPEPHHFNLGNYEFIGTVTDYKFNGIMIDHYTEKYYEIKGLYPSAINKDLEPNKRDITITINFNGIDNSGEERNKTKIWK